MAAAAKWGILSTADINRKLIPGAHASPKVDLLAVASRDQDRAEAYVREWQIERAYGSYDELLADPDIEAVYNPLPNTMHAEWSIKAHDADNIRLRTDVEGGALMDVGCYCVSGSRLLAGEPESVYGSSWIGETGTDWVFAGTMRFPDGVLATFDCGTALCERDELDVIG